MLHARPYALRRTGRKVASALPKGAGITAARLRTSLCAACWFAERTGGFAAIGSIHDTQALLRGEAGTRVALDTAGVDAVSAG